MPPRSRSPQRGRRPSQPRPAPRVDPLVGTTIESLEVLRPGAEGVAVGRHEDGRVVLVRHALPGEVVDATITAVGKGGRMLRADATAVVHASADRVTSACPYSKPGGCGGCDLLFATPEAQRQWKAAVFGEQLQRIAGVDMAVPVEAVGELGQSGWRTRVRFGVTPEGRLGLRETRSHDITAIATCLQTVPAIADLELADVLVPGAREVIFAAGSAGVVAAIEPPEFAEQLARELPMQVSVVGVRGSSEVEQSFGRHTWALDVDSFWQAHVDAPRVLTGAVRSMLAPRPGEHLLDLFAGAGLFAASLADDLGPGGRIDAVEGLPAAVMAGADALADISTLQWHVADVGEWLADRSSVRRADLVVLDPPRTGAGVDVIAGIIARMPRAIAYVSCDGATFARDLKAALEAGWQVAQLRAFDLFPGTAHLETVALLVPGDPSN